MRGDDAGRAERSRVPWERIAFVSSLLIFCGCLLLAFYIGGRHQRRINSVCSSISRSAQRGWYPLDRSNSEYLEEAAQKYPRILASQASAREARRIAGREQREWPVIEVNGKWFILQNQGHPAADGGFTVTVVDVESKRLVGSIADSTGHVPIVAPVPTKRGGSP